MPPSIPPAKGSDPEDVAWALQTADALWRRSERADALAWLRRAVQAAGEADDPERAFALADAAAELTEQLGLSQIPPPVRIESSPPPRISPDASGSIEISMADLPEEDAATSVRLAPTFPPDAGDEIDDLLGSGEIVAPLPPAAPPPLMPRSAESPAAPKVAAPRPPPLPPRKKLPPARLPPPPSSSREPLSLSSAQVIGSNDVDAQGIATSVQAEGIATSAHGDGLAPVQAYGSSPPVQAYGMAPSVQPDDIPTSVPAAMPPSDPPQSSVPSRPIPLPRGALFEDSTPFLPPTDSDEHDAVSIGNEHLAEGFDTLVRRAPKLALQPSVPPAPQHTVPAPPQFTEPPPEIVELEAASQPEPYEEPAPISLVPESDPEPEYTQISLAPPPLEPELQPESTPEPEAHEEPEPASPPRVPAQLPPTPAPSPPPVVDSPSAEAPVAAASALSLDAEAFADLPDEARDTFAAAGIVHELGRDEEVPAAALCYVLEGEVRVSSAVVDAAGLIMKAGEVLRSRGTIEANLPLRLSAQSDNARVATWATHAVDDAFASCPWVEDDLRGTANRTLAICGATIGPLGERLDEGIFLDAMARFEVMVLLPGEVFIEAGSPLPGLCIVGVGEVIGASPHGPGDFVFPEGVLTLAPSPVPFKAGPEGALILTASRSAAQELLVTCPPLLEILAGM